MDALSRAQPRPRSAAAAAAAASPLPWARFSAWLECVCVVTFDLELGQAMEAGSRSCALSAGVPTPAAVKRPFHESGF